MALVYEIVKHDPPRDMRSAAQLRCAECGDTGNIIIAGMGNNPEKIQKLFIQIGWDADVFHKAKNWCPKCVRQRRIRVANEEGIPKLPEGVRVLPSMLPAPVTPTQRVAAPKIIPDHFSIGSGTRTSSSKEVNPVTDIRKLTTEQKSSLRTGLESFFNPDTGRFEDGWSDHRISEELQIPRAVVAEFREIFFGEIKTDPEIVAFVQQYEEAKRVMGNLQSSLEKMHTKLEALLKKHGVN